MVGQSDKVTRTRSQKREEVKNSVRFIRLWSKVGAFLVLCIRGAICFLLTKVLAWALLGVSEAYTKKALSPPFLLFNFGLPKKKAARFCNACVPV